MKHRTLPRYWRFYEQLPKEIQALADKNFKLLKINPYHPSLHFKKVGKLKELWSVRVGAGFRALGREKPDGVLWFWIGTHAEYNKLIR